MCVELTEPETKIEYKLWTLIQGSSNVAASLKLLEFPFAYVNERQSDQVRTKFGRHLGPNFVACFVA